MLHVTPVRRAAYKACSSDGSTSCRGAAQTVAGSANIWGFSICRASNHDYQPGVLHIGMTVASPKTPSIPPAAFTSTTPALGPDRRRGFKEKH